ncbi:putative outer membrane starch-binding protein [Dyadobacter jejuensis]|uniref:Putative outer membrane starch-binding protein n=1 Tax=Dyadobacter jejuensis TaxID=1082580 RepID=A0A316AQL4_9BACT|nr:RagB/SusD family nutrient uptake outer membrane protein [Dyadobacter jejuensis]PWJ59579.1 putative outer membrane starch-binding protein [Dyadobacter jejuensis]
MRSIQIIGLLLGLLMVGQGCQQDEFLTLKNPNTITTDTYWQTPSQFQSGLASVYSALQFDAVSGKSLSNDMCRGDLAGTESWYSEIAFRNLTFNDNTEYVSQRWNQLYVGVFRANQVIENLKKEGIDLTEQDKKVLGGQARFLRAMFYFWLVNSYDGAVIQLDVAKEDADFSKAFSSQEEVYQQVILPDLTYASENLPKRWTNAKDLGRVTWGAAMSMLGKVHLYQKNWAEAATFFKAVVDSKVYSLMPNYLDNFTDEKEHNAESIFEVSFSNALKPGVNSGIVDDNIYEKGAEASGMAVALGQLSFGAYNTTLPSYYAHELFVNDEPDASSPINEGRKQSARTYASIVPINGDGLYYQLPIGKKPGWAFGQSAYVKKYTNWYHWTQEDAVYQRSGINFRHIRLADIYLMYAEAILNRDGNAGVSEAMAAIDIVRKRAGVVTLAQYMDKNGGKIPLLHRSYIKGARTYLAPDAGVLLTHLQRVERPVELAFEGHRWYDLVRWGIVKEIFTELRVEEEWRQKNIDLKNPVAPLFIRERIRPDFTVASTAYNPAAHDYLPIPTGEVQSNPNLKK